MFNDSEQKGILEIDERLYYYTKELQKMCYYYIEDKRNSMYFILITD